MSASLFAKGKDQGFLHLEEIRAAFPNAEDDVSSLDEFYSSLFENGIEVVDQHVAKHPPSDVVPFPPRIVADDGGAEVLTADPQWPVDEETGLAGMLVR